MEITKQNLIDLIKACSKDPDMINCKWDTSSHSRYNVLKKGIESRYDKFNLYTTKYFCEENELSRYQAKLKFKEVSHNDSLGMGYNITLSFDNMPQISISLTCSYLPYDNGVILASKKYWFSKQKTITFKTTKVDIQHSLKCGNYSFSLTEDETKELYDYIETEKKNYLKSIEDKEILQRFDKYLTKQ